MEFDLNRSMAVLERTPAVLKAMLAGLPEEWTHTDEGPETWRPFDVIGHLIDGEETDWLARARIILAQGDDRRFEPYDRFRHLELTQGKSLGELLDRFSELRAQNLREIERWALTPEQLRLEGEHPEFGRVTLSQLLATWVAHDMTHIVQIARTMARQYRDAVGPWKAYLGVLG